MQEQQIKDWVSHGPELNLLQAAENLGKTLCREKLTTSQIRQVFTRLKSIEAKGFTGQRTEFMMLKPYIAYAAGRQDKVRGLHTFKKKITCGIDFVLQADDEQEQQKRFYNFCKFFEAVLAYHRASGGK